MSIKHVFKTEDGNPYLYVYDDDHFLINENKSVVISNLLKIILQGEKNGQTQPN